MTSAFMQDYSAGHISTAESRRIINDVNKHFGDGNISFYPGVSYRHLMVWKGGRTEVRCTPPHDIPGRKISGYLPSGRGGDVLRRLMEKTGEFLMTHPVNRKRIRKRTSPSKQYLVLGTGETAAHP